MRTRARSIRTAGTLIAAAIIVSSAAVPVGASHDGPHAFAGSSTGNTSSIPNTDDATPYGDPAIALANGKLHVVVSTQTGLVHAWRNESTSPPGSWNQATIPNTTSSDVYPYMVARPNGSLVLAFHHSGPPNTLGAYFLTKPGSDRTFPAANFAGGSPQNPFNDQFVLRGMEAASDGTIHLALNACSNCTGQGVHYAHGIPGSWHGPTKIPSTGVDDYPFLAVDSNGTPFIAFSDTSYCETSPCSAQDDDGTYTMKQKLDGGWSPPVRRNGRAFGYATDFEVRDGKVFLVYARTCFEPGGCANDGLFLGTDANEINGSYPYRTTRLPGTDRFDDMPRLSRDGGGKLFASFRNGDQGDEFNDPRRWMLMRWTPTPTGWTDPVQRSAAVTSYGQVELEAADDEAHLAFITHYFGG